MEAESQPTVSSDEQADLDRLVRDAVWQAREQVLRLKGERPLISKHYDYPELGQYDSGQITINFKDGPTNYAHVFKVGSADQWSVSYDEVPALGELGQLAIEDANLRARLLIPGVEIDEWRERWIRIGASLVPLQILDRLMNTVGEEFSEGDFLDAWTPMRNALLWESLPVDIAIPVALVSFDLPVPFELAPGITLEPIPEDEQRARVPHHIFNGIASPNVVGAATHAVVLNYWKLPGQGRLALEYGEPSFYPLETIELVFQALRLATAHPLGYAQTYMRPRGWAWDYTADLPPIVRGSLARRYPPAFDSYGWLKEAKVITSEEIADAGAMLSGLQDASRSLKLASRRFSGAALRADEDDAILDLCIALEAALGDSQRSEMTYKLGMRTAAIISISGDGAGDHIEVLKQVKRLYDWRSAVAHGDDQERARRRYIEVAGGADGVDSATEMLRTVISQLIRRSDLREPETIDRLLVQGVAPAVPIRPEAHT
jgi:hypothetical protein